MTNSNDIASHKRERFATPNGAGVVEDSDIIRSAACPKDEIPRSEAPSYFQWRMAQHILKPELSGMIFTGGLECIARPSGGSAGQPGNGFIPETGSRERRAIESLPRVLHRDRERATAEAAGSVRDSDCVRMGCVLHMPGAARGACILGLLEHLDGKQSLTVPAQP